MVQSGAFRSQQTERPGLTGARPGAGRAFKRGKVSARGTGQQEIRTQKTNSSEQEEHKEQEGARAALGEQLSCPPLNPLDQRRKRRQKLQRTLRCASSVGCHILRRARPSAQPPRSSTAATRSRTRNTQRNIHNRSEQT